MEAGRRPTPQPTLSPFPGLRPPCPRQALVEELTEQQRRELADSNPHTNDRNAFRYDPLSRRVRRAGGRPPGAIRPALASRGRAPLTARNCPLHRPPPCAARPCANGSRPPPSTVHTAPPPKKTRPPPLHPARASYHPCPRSLQIEVVDPELYMYDEEILKKVGGLRSDLI